jgi:hypothetical protein
MFVYVTNHFKFVSNFETNYIFRLVLRDGCKNLESDSLKISNSVFSFVVKFVLQLSSLTPLPPSTLPLLNLINVTLDVDEIPLLFP